jgi:hypothetical protein
MTKTNHKETEMNAWKTLALAGAAVALAAPAANAKFDSSMPSKALHAKVTPHKHVDPKPKTNTTPRVLIIVTQFAPTPQDTSGDDCAMTANNCTDQQLCDLWGMNCDLVAHSSATVAATEDQTATP